MKFSDVPNGSYFVCINPNESMPIFYKDLAGKIRRVIDDFNKSEDYNDNLVPEVSVQLVHIKDSLLSKD